MKDTRQFIRTGGFLGIASGVAIVLSALSTTITAGVARPDNASELAAFFDDVGSNGYGFHLYGWTGLLALLLAVPFTYALFLFVREALSEAWLGAIAMWAGLIVLFPAYILNILIATKLEPLFDELGESATDPMYIFYESNAGLAALMFLLGSLLTFSIAPWLLSLAWLRTTTSPRWIGWLGVFAGVTGLAWVVMLADEPGLFQLVWIINLLANTVWIIAAGTVMTKYSNSTPDTVA